MAGLPNDVLFSMYLKRYYNRMFPYDKYFEWLNYAHEGFNKVGQIGRLPYREFSFTIHNEIYIRYQTFENLEELKAKMRELNPRKIDLGAEFEDRPSKLRARLLEPERRELVFDIDITDYDQVRFCCRGAKFCQKCWTYMKIAVKIIEKSLKEDFDYHHTLWVYSGRRGIHCWVCDQTARKLPYYARKSIADYLSLVTLNDKKKLRFYQTPNLHPVIQRSCQIIDQYFLKLCIEDQDILGDDSRIKKFMQFIPDELFKKQLSQKFAKSTTSLDRWNGFLSLYDTFSQKGYIKHNMFQIRELIKINYAYPRLDINVTKGFKHLLKSPYCVHPNTMQICVPFNPRAVDSFDPFKVPTIDKIMDELSEYEDKHNDLLDPISAAVERLQFGIVEETEDGRKTSLLKSLNVFDQFIAKLQLYKGAPPPPDPFTT